MSNRPSVIPSPPRVLWAEFRARYIPPIVMGVTALAAFWLWGRVTDSHVVQGVGEGLRCAVISPRHAFVGALLVPPYSRVKKGDPLVAIHPYDAVSRLDMLRTELELDRLRNQPTISEQNAMNYERIRVEWHREISEWAMARVKHEQAEKDLRRNQSLLSERLISQDLYDLSLRERDLYRAEMDEKRRAAAEINLRLEKLRVLGDPLAAPARAHPTNQFADYSAQLATIHTNAAAIVLTSPLDGMVGAPARQSGEFVLEGEPILVVGSEKAERVVGYLREPYPFEPRVGMAVDLHPRTRRRGRFQGEVASVGAQLETITNALALIRPMALVDSGLPIVVAVPEGLNLRPGETVDLHLIPD